MERAPHHECVFAPRAGKRWRIVTLTPGDAGAFTMSGIIFFQAGYWEQILNLMPASAAADKAKFAICIL